MNRYKMRVMFFLLCYTSVIFMCLTWIYSTGEDVPQTVVGRSKFLQADDRGEHAELAPLPTPIWHPDSQVQGYMGEPDPHCPDNANKTQLSSYQHLDSRNFFLSAYYDERKHPDVFIRIISLQPRGYSQPLYCLVGGDNTALQAVQVQRYPFNENHGKQFGGLILSCLLKNLVERNPCKVSISREPQPTADMVTLPLRHIPARKSEYRSEFAVCIPPLHGDVTVETLVDFVETSRLLGADHFYFYRYDGDLSRDFASLPIQTVTRYYADKGLATVYPWYLPVHNRHIWYNGQVLAIHHCLYQNMWKHKYLAFNDIDEFLVPHRHGTWSSLMAELDDDQHSGFQFVSAFFSLESEAQPMVLHNALRSDINAVRTKCVVKPERIFEMGIHHISKWNEERWEPIKIEPSHALLHHYRRCDPFFGQRGFRCNPRVTDQSIFKYKDQLEKQFNLALQEVHDSMHKNS